MDTPEEVHIRGFGFKSANDAPGRDPDRVVIWVGGEEYEFDLSFDERFSTVNFLDDVDVTANKVLFSFKNSELNEIQLG